MSKVLVIEPHRMLQQALAIALVPEFQLQFETTIPDDVRISDFDVVIVDAAALEEVAVGAAATVPAVPDWQVPTVRISKELTSQATKRPGVIRITAPISKDSLRLALAQCLAGDSGNSMPSVPAAKKAKATEPVKQQKPKSVDARAAEEQPGVIELVDVIEVPE
jgi:hypothetical protein